jgi:hypothetical protein
MTICVADYTSLPLIAVALTCRRYCAPALVQAIWCFLHIRQLISWLTVDSTWAVETRSLFRNDSA